MPFLLRRDNRNRNNRNNRNKVVRPCYAVTLLRFVTLSSQLLTTL